MDTPQGPFRIDVVVDDLWQVAKRHPDEYTVDRIGRAIASILSLLPEAMRSHFDFYLNDLGNRD